MEATLELPAITMMRSKTFTYLTCTNDRCGNNTTKHEILSAEQVSEAGLHGEGWYRCSCCGTNRQHLKCKSSGRWSSPYEFMK